MTRADTIYQDPEGAGSLSGLLQLWQRLCAAGREGDSNRVSFTLSCHAEARANRVAGFLRRRRACTDTQVHHVDGARRDTWHVHGSMLPEVHSLSDLEATWTWLRRAAQSHQVDLLRITLGPAAA